MGRGGRGSAAVPGGAGRGRSAPAEGTRGATTGTRTRPSGDSVHPLRFVHRYNHAPLQQLRSTATV